MCKCPSCKSSVRKRLARNFILKLIPNSKYYSCHDCKTKFIKIPFFYRSIAVKKYRPKNIDVITN